MRSASTHTGSITALTTSGATPNSANRDGSVRSNATSATSTVCLRRYLTGSFAAEALFGDGKQYFPIAHDARRGVMHVVADAQTDHAAGNTPFRANRIKRSLLPSA